MGDAKESACGIGTGVIGFTGLGSKQSASDVSNAITSTVLDPLYVLLVHFVIALLEF